MPVCDFMINLSPLLRAAFLLGVVIASPMMAQAQSDPVRPRIVLAQGTGVPQRVFRPDDVRPERNEVRAAELGIQKYTSRHLVLYTDIDPAIAKTLPPLVDAAYLAWTQYFGELPPARDGSEFQITGYLMQDQERFTAAGMQPAGFMMSRFGRQVGREFWMLEQNSDYYRRHLLIHEATHSFMTVTPSALPPLWYLEGMAEFFATHRIDSRGQVAFGVFPDESLHFPDWGRIEIIRQEWFHKRPVTLQQIGAFTNEQFAKPPPVPYSWSWAICAFLQQHPRYQSRFQTLGQNLDRSAFQRVMGEVFESDRRLLTAEWAEFSRRLDYGIDVAANAFQTHPPRTWPSENEATITLPATAGWQSTGLHVDAGTEIEITATGQVTLNPAKPAWVSEPQGLSLEYAGGHPIGTLLAGWLPLASAVDKETAIELDVVPIGPHAAIRPERASELWLRVNDQGHGLKDNDGTYQVRLRRVR